MTMQEFETRTGIRTDAEAYERIEKVYMALDMDKDEFCAKWKKSADSRFALTMEAVEALTEDCDLAAKQVQAEQKAHEQDRADHRDELKCLYRWTIENRTGKVQEYCEMKLSAAELIECKLRSGIQLTEEEIKVIVNKLK